MPSTYPASLDSFSTSHADGVNEIIHAADVNNLADAVNKVETELGINPKGTAASVAARLNGGSQSAIFNVKDLYGAKGDGATDDRAAIQAALDAANVAGGGVVYFPRGNYFINSSSGTITLPGDDGTVLAGHGGALAAETPGTMPYALKTYPGVYMLGAGRRATKITGPWTYGSSAVDTSQLIGLTMGDYASSTNGITVEGIQFQNFFIPVMGFGQITACNFRRVQVATSAFSFVMQCSDFVDYDDVRITATAAGIVNGGWWTYRNNSYTSANIPYAWSPGYTDKTKIDRLNYQNTITHTAYEDSIDAFFDTYFFKTANNATRLSTAIDVGTAGTAAPYLGVVGAGATFHARYGRPNFANEGRGWFVFGAERYVLNAGIPYLNRLSSLYAERIGYFDKNNYGSTKRFGLDYTNPYIVAAKIQAAIYGVTGSQNEWDAVYFDPIASVTMISTGGDQWRDLRFNATDVTTGQNANLFSTGTVRLSNVSDTAPSVLDYYLEGTFTPTVQGTSTAGTATYSTQLGRYTRVGNRVHFNIVLAYTVATGTGNIQVAGLPYASNASEILAILNVYSASGVSYTGSYLTGYVEVNASTLLIRQVATTGAGSGVPMVAAGTVYISGSYEAA